MGPTETAGVVRTDPDRTFHHLLVNTALAGLTTSYLWFGLTFWAYLQTRSVMATGIIGGAYMLLVAFSSVFFGTLVDHHRKLPVMRFSSTVTLVAFTVAGLLYLAIPDEDMTDLTQPWFWTLSVIILAGAVVEHMRNIALSTCVTILIPDERRANANGLVGSVHGIAFIATSVLSGLSIGLLGMGWTIVVAIGLIAVGLAHLATLRMPQEVVPAASEEGDAPGRIDLAGSLAVIRSAPGLLSLIFFATFNNLIGGVYMALMDPYGLELFSVEMWGIVFGVASTGFIVGGLVIAKTGLGANPMRTLLLAVMVMGFLGAIFTIREWAWLYVLGIFVYLCLIPAVEAAEQTVIQRVVPLRRQGRVFGLAMAVESAAAPVTAFLIAPLAEFWIFPWVRSPEGRESVAWLLGEGEARGIALVFLVAGLIMVAAALLAMASPAYRALSRSYTSAAPPEDGSLEDLPDDGVPAAVVGR
ncbi:MFS transporter [Serinicoccus kebangsaanensis]|uniref:MFS transporter n=1 Tax=Serinicoccus kebangsaanensis TaxID=2602069 RepID=UPI001EE18DE1|nr:MFS transporter [Serinicoccus kebangsaanensis]